MDDNERLVLELEVLDTFHGAISAAAISLGCFIVWLFLPMWFWAIMAMGWAAYSTYLWLLRRHYVDGLKRIPATRRNQALEMKAQRLAQQELDRLGIDFQIID